MHLLKSKKNPIPAPSEEEKQEASGNSFAVGYRKFEQILGKIIMTVYHLRKILMAAPVAYMALRIAAYNMSHLPEQVGVNLQTTGEFAMQISRYAAVIGPLGITAGCLVMMFFSRKAMYAWAISFFTLALPLLLLLSNAYPT